MAGSHKNNVINFFIDFAEINICKKRVLSNGYCGLKGNRNILTAKNHFTS